MTAAAASEPGQANSRERFVLAAPLCIWSSLFHSRMLPVYCF